MNFKSMSRRNILASPLGVPALALSASGGASAATETGSASPFTVVAPGTHPGIVFSAEELPALRRRARGTGLAAEAYQRVRAIAQGPAELNLDMKSLVGRRGIGLAATLEATALVYQIEEDRDAAGRALEILEKIAVGVDPTAFFKEVDSDFFATEHWPKALAFAWDWLYPAISEERRAPLLAGLEAWSAALFAHTNAWWWRDATYNCGAIPVGAHGLLLMAIRGESKHPEFGHWLAEALRKMSRNYFPLTWRDNGLCNEGPGYAHYHKNCTQFADALRRTGGPDWIATSGAVNAMHYLRHQWMPQGRCATVGDNTEYGRRVFQAIYLLGIREMQDAAGLWTFEKYADRRRTEAFLQFLYYPDGLKPVSPAVLQLPTSHYFEFDKNRAGYLFARSEWENERAHWFAFSTRYENANHAHYDMNSFVFTAFGEEFAAHSNIYPYTHPLHGADLEHNIVIIDEGGMAVADNPGSAGDDGSILGYLTGCATGEFADYVRGDARRSYADRSVRTDKPAKQADRAAVFVKEGPNPYVVLADNIQKDDAEHDYRWQWYTMAHEIEGEGSVARPFRIRGKRAHCKIVFLAPEQPSHAFEVVRNQEPRRTDQWGLLRVHLRGISAHYFAMGIAWDEGAPEPTVEAGPVVTGAVGARSLLVKGEGFEDLVVWQPGSEGARIQCGTLETDGLMAVVRSGKEGKPAAYLLGDGTSLDMGGRRLVDAAARCSVSANEKRVVVSPWRRAERGEEPIRPPGGFWKPAAGAEIWDAWGAIPRRG